MPQEYKVKAVEELKEKLDNSKNFYLTDYRGLNVEQITDLRTKLREKDSEYKVVKNNFFKLALKEKGIDGVDDFLKGPIGVTFIKSDDPVSPAKVIVDFTKNFKKEKIFKVIGGYFEGRAVDGKEVISISSLPTKEVLLAQIMGCIQGPARGIAVCTAGPIKGIMQCLNAWIDKNS